MSVFNPLAPEAKHERPTSLQIWPYLGRKGLTSLCLMYCILNKLITCMLPPVTHNETVLVTNTCVTPKEISPIMLSYHFVLLTQILFLRNAHYYKRGFSLHHYTGSFSVQIKRTALINSSSYRQNVN